MKPYKKRRNGTERTKKRKNKKGDEDRKGGGKEETKNGGRWKNKSGDNNLHCLCDGTIFAMIGLQVGCEGGEHDSAFVITVTNNRVCLSSSVFSLHVVCAQTHTLVVTSSSKNYNT